MKKKIIFGILVILGIISVFSYENIDFYRIYNLNKIGISEYGSGNYEVSQLIFSGAQLNQTDAILEYNKANSLYKLGANSNNMKDKVEYFQKALDSYSGSLHLENNSDTRDNIIFIESILDTLSDSEQKEEKTPPNPLEEGEENGENFDEEDKNGENDNGKEGDNREESESGKEGGKNKSDNSGEEGNTREPETQEVSLSEEQKEQIEKYSDQLKKSEYYNQKYFNKKPQEINRDMNDLYRDPFLEDGFVRGGEKDW